MTLDVLILCGGQGTRLRKLWAAPKCLVPVGGVPLLERLLALLVPLKPGFVCLATGAGHDEVWNTPLICFAQTQGLLISHSRDGSHTGTARAVRVAAAEKGLIGAPLLVLNGDTLPLYDLSALVRYHRQRLNIWATAAFKHNSEQWRDTYAGACILSDAALTEICADTRTHDFPVHLLGAQRFVVPSFLDVGTPEGFQRAKEWRE